MKRQNSLITNRVGLHSLLPANSSFGKPPIYRVGEKKPDHREKEMQQYFLLFINQFTV